MQVSVIYFAARMVAIDVNDAHASRTFKCSTSIFRGIQPFFQQSAPPCAHSLRQQNFSCRPNGQPYPSIGRLHSRGSETDATGFISERKSGGGGLGAFLKKGVR